MASDIDKDPEYEERLRSRLNALQNMLERGTIKFASHLGEGIKASLHAIQTGADGEIDLSTVDARVRSLALAAEAHQQRETVKGAASLQDISSNYFDFLESQFGNLQTSAKNIGLDIHEASVAISQNDENVKELTTALPEILDRLDQFWGSASEVSEAHIQDIQGTKAIFGGDLFPSQENSIASSVGLYVDTIVLPDPIHRSKLIFETVSDQHKAYYLVKHALNALRYRDLALADVSKPIVTINPYRSSVYQDEEELLNRSTEDDVLKHASAIFGQNFANFENLLEFISPLDTPEKFIEKVANQDLVLFDTSWSGDKKSQIARALKDAWGELGGEHHVGKMVVYQNCMGRMRQATDILLNSRYLFGTPLIDAPTSWQYFNWKLEYNAKHDPITSSDLHMIQGLQRTAETDEKWLGNIPHDALIEMRQQNAFAEIREVLSKGVEDIAAAKPDKFFRSSDQIVDNIRTAFEKHSEEIKALTKKKIKFAGYDLGSMLITLGIDVASVVVGTPTFGAATIAKDQLLDAPKLREIPKRFRDLKNADIELRKSPMGLFFAHK